MIVVDTSALMAVLLDEPDAPDCEQALSTDHRILISAATLAEALIVAERRGLGAEMAMLIDDLGIEVLDVTRTAARQTADAYARWGKGIDPASLNFGDCFAYAAAMTHGCPLLYVGTDFAQTDVKGAMEWSGGM